MRIVNVVGARPNFMKIAPTIAGRQDKGHADIVRASFDFFQQGGEPPIPYDRLIETTRATLAARDALQRRVSDAVAVGQPG